MQLELVSSPIDLLRRYQSVRDLTLKICEPLSIEDCCIQSMPDASPTRWHLAHTTWFFETFILTPFAKQIPKQTEYQYLFNSYYNALGEQFPRDQRGLLSRPTVQEIYRYRQEVDQAMFDFLSSANELSIEIQALLLIGINHEQQHLELILTDIKHAFSLNPLLPAYSDDQFENESINVSVPLGWIAIDEGLYEIGTDQNTDIVGQFSFDNERPSHCVYLHRYRLADRLVTNFEYQAFVSDSGYQRSEFWLSQGWDIVSRQRRCAPLYWHNKNGKWYEFTLAGLQPLQAARPVCHMSYFEADAFARWSGKRLPTEQEWEVAANRQFENGMTNTNFCDRLLLQRLAIHPRLQTAYCNQSLSGNLWQWTSSSYNAYPGFKAAVGAVGEYNGKFMSNQYVLRGGSVATPSDHIRNTYRNFFPTDTRWQFTGIRLAEDAY